MEIYEFLRDLADSWVLVLLFSFFVASILWAFRPGSTKVYDDTMQIPFRNEDKPASEAAAGTEEAL